MRMVKAVADVDETSAVDTIVLAFGADPAARWTWPDASQFLTHMPSLVRALGGNAFVHGGAYCTDGCTGAALWLPPGIPPNEQGLTALVGTTVAPAIQADLFGVFEQMATFHPSEPHWYLPFIGVDPAQQGKGLGDALMTYALERCDRDHVPAYLESSNPRNISLYQRHGFRAVGSIQVGTSPQIVPMLRAAR